MARWEPDARRRLQEAALELYAERGFDGTTAAQIAERAGLTERTFFRHFGDKREVLFGNEAAVTDGTSGRGDRAGTDPIAAALEAAAAHMQPRRDALLQQAAIIAAHPELQERELRKQASMVAALAQALEQRGRPADEARLAAELAIAVLRVTFERWLVDDTDLSDLTRAALRQARATFA